MRFIFDKNVIQQHQESSEVHNFDITTPQDYQTVKILWYMKTLWHRSLPLRRDGQRQTDRHTDRCTDKQTGRITAPYVW